MGAATPGSQQLTDVGELVQSFSPNRILVYMKRLVGPSGKDGRT
jgi:hypothetical protein